MSLKAIDQSQEKVIHETESSLSIEEAKDRCQQVILDFRNQKGIPPSFNLLMQIAKINPKKHPSGELQSHYRFLIAVIDAEKVVKTQLHDLVSASGILNDYPELENVYSYERNESYAKTKKANFMTEKIEEDVQGKLEEYIYEKEFDKEVKKREKQEKKKKLFNLKDYQS